MAFALGKFLCFLLSIQFVLSAEPNSGPTPDGLPYAVQDYSPFSYGYADGQPKFFFYPLFGQNKPSFLVPAQTTAKPQAPTTVPGVPTVTGAPTVPTVTPPTPITIIVTQPPPSGSCTGTVGGVSVAGTCSSSCASGTVNSGLCTTGTIGLCCASAFNTCGQSSNARTAYFMNPAFPSPHTVANGACTFTIQRASPDICIARVDYTRVILSPAPGTACAAAEDTLGINGIVNGATTPAYSTCSTHINDYAFVEFGLTNNALITATPVNIAFDNQRVWNIKITQIPNSCSTSG